LNIPHQELLKMGLLAWRRIEAADDVAIVQSVTKRFAGPFSPSRQAVSGGSKRRVM